MADRILSLIAVNKDFFDILKNLLIIILASKNKITDQKLKYIRFKKLDWKFKFLIITVMLSHICTSIDLSYTLF